MNNEKDKLEAILQMINEFNATGADILLSTKDFLDKLICVIKNKEIKVIKSKPLDHIIISCDASIKVNPGGPASIGCIIQFPDIANRKDLELAQITSDTTNNLAEYSAVYLSLTTLMNLYNNPGCKIEIRTDSQLVVKQIKGEMICKNPKLQVRRDAIRELVAALPIPVEFIWRPRNSTNELTRANFLAQDTLGVPRH